MNGPSRKWNVGLPLKRSRPPTQQNLGYMHRGKSPPFILYCYCVLVMHLTSRSCVYGWLAAESGTCDSCRLASRGLRGAIFGDALRPRASRCQMLLQSVDAAALGSLSVGAKGPKLLRLGRPKVELPTRQQQHKEQRQRKAHTPSMFSSGNFAPADSSALLPMGYHMGLVVEKHGKFVSNGRGRLPSCSAAANKPGRRVLGFDVLSLDATPSNVNMETWKRGDSGVSDPQPFFSSPVATIDINWNSLGTDISTTVQRFPFLPWIPNRSQIDALKVVELKRACEERGLQRSGNKAALRDRLWDWVVDQEHQNQVKIMGDFLTRHFEGSTSLTLGNSTNVDLETTHSRVDKKRMSTPNSLAEWARNVDLEPLLRKRKEIHRQKSEGRPVPRKPTPDGSGKQPSTEEYLKSLARALRAPSSPFASNIKVKELYAASKQADQLGERLVAIDLLRTLLMVTPSDARVYRRLSRLYAEQGDVGKARETLLAGLQGQEHNPWIWHGLAQLERKHGSHNFAREYFEKAIQCDPTFAQAYHALGSLEHAQGNIANATRIIKKGLEYCPANHRLWHACGGVYRAAQLLEDADRCYRRVLKHGPPTSHCFAYTSLAAVAYEQGQVDRARSLLVKALRVNNGRHAQGWVALAQLEEAEGRIDQAKHVCISAVANYERSLLEARQRFLRKSGQKLSILPPKTSNSTGSVEIANELLYSVPKYRSGDKFVHVYRNWARLEERYGSFESVDRVYERARNAFPQDYKLLLSWAQYHSNMLNHDRARTIFQEACRKVGNRHADPYRLSAELEMSLANFQDARRILFLGAQAVVESSAKEGYDKKGLPQLLHTWAVCEWSLGNLDRAEVLFHNAWRLMQAGVERGCVRAYLLYSIARLKQRLGKLYFAQHFIALALKENSFPGGNAPLWALWAEIAGVVGNKKLETECLAEYWLAMESRPNEHEYSQLLRARSSSEVSSAVKPNVEKLLSRDPWQVKLFSNESTARLQHRLKLPLEKPSFSVAKASF